MLIIPLFHKDSEKQIQVQILGGFSAWGKLPHPTAPAWSCHCALVSCFLWFLHSRGCPRLAFAPGFALVSTRVSCPWSVLDDALCCDRNSCASAAPQLCSLARQPRRASGGGSRGEKRGSETLPVLQSPQYNTSLLPRGNMSS